MSGKNYETSFVAGQRLSVLMAEDSPSDAELCVRALKRGGFSVIVDVVASSAEFSQKLNCGSYDVVLADFNLPGWSALDALELVKQNEKDIPFILVTGVLREETALEFICNGVDDYILKDRLSRLPLAVRRVLREKRLLAERERAAREREQLLHQLREALAEVRRLNGLLPICVSCKRVMSAKGFWSRIEIYIEKFSDARVSPCLCPQCSRNLYPERAN